MRLPRDQELVVEKRSGSQWEKAALRKYYISIKLFIVSVNTDFSRNFRTKRFVVRLCTPEPRCEQ
jgi:hypothetical protein